MHCRWGGSLGSTSPAKPLRTAWATVATGAARDAGVTTICGSTRGSGGGGRLGPWGAEGTAGAFTSTQLHKWFASTAHGLAVDTLKLLAAVCCVLRSCPKAQHPRGLLRGGESGGGAGPETHARRVALLGLTGGAGPTGALVALGAKGRSIGARTQGLPLVRRQHTAAALKNYGAKHGAFESPTKP